MCVRVPGITEISRFGLSEQTDVNQEDRVQVFCILEEEHLV